MWIMAIGNTLRSERNQWSVRRGQTRMGNQTDLPELRRPVLRFSEGSGHLPGLRNGVRSGRAEQAASSPRPGQDRPGSGRGCRGGGRGGRGGGRDRGRGERGGRGGTRGRQGQRRGGG